MEAKNFTLKTKIRFTTNKGSFEYQPVVTLLDNKSITGGKFLSLYRIVRSRDESNDIQGIVYDTGGNVIDPDDIDGIMGISYGDGYTLSSFTGTRSIKSRSIVPVNENVEENSTTAEAVEYIFSLISDEENKISLVVDDNSIIKKDIYITDINNNNDLYNYVGMGFRPYAEVTPPTGEMGSSLVLQYMFHAMEDTGEDFATSGLTGFHDWSGNSITASINGKGAGDMANFGSDPTVSGTVTGHTYGPIEGAFRIDGDTFIKSAASSYFSTRHESTSGYTIMSHVKLFATGDCNIISITDGTDIMGEIKISEGSLVFSNDNGSLTAGSITADGENAATGDFANNKLSKWAHITAVVDASTNSTSGAKLYINGTKSVLAGIQDSVSASLTSIPEFVSPENAYAIIGKSIDEISNGLTGVIGLTRIFNRPLSDAEIFENFITSIPGQVVCNEINIS